MPSGLQQPSRYIQAKQLPTPTLRPMHSSPPSPPPSPQPTAASLFHQILSQQQLQHLQHLPQSQITLLCRQTSLLFHRKLTHKPNQTMTFLSNYHRLVLGYHNRALNNLVNNLSLHFLLLSSYAMIATGQKDQARTLLKKSLSYLASTEPDPILLTAALNNLTVLRMEKGKYYKSINVLLETVGLMERHMRGLKGTRKRGQVMEDSVLLVNSYYLLTKCLLAVMGGNSKPFYRELYNCYSQAGIRKAIKYLGRESVLTQNFIKLADHDTSQVSLPIFIQEQQQRSTNEEKFMRALERIEKLLQAPREPVIIKEIVKQAPPPVAKPITRREGQSLVCKCSRLIDGWQVQAQIFKQKEEKFGSFVFNCTRRQELVTMVISEQRMFKMFTQMNLADVLPQECTLDNMAPGEILQNCVLKFMHIDDNKNIELYPRAKTLVPVFVESILGRQYLCFVYHVRETAFRVCFGEKKRAETLALEIELDQAHMGVEVRDEVTRKMSAIYSQLAKQMNIENKNKEEQAKSVKVIDEGKFVGHIRQILKKMQAFMTNHVTQGLQYSQLENCFIKYVQAQKIPEHGKFYFIRFVHNVKGFDIYVENTYETYKPDGKTKAKGNTLYTANHFFRDFGIRSEVGLTRFRAFCQILCRKFTLKFFDVALSTKDVDTYQQNCISQFKISSKTYLRRMLAHQHNTLPLTVSIVSINNAIPIGLKLTCYSPIQCFEVGYFIHICSCYWRWPEKPEEKPKDFISNVVEEYGYRRDYFLGEWLERKGFVQVLGLVRIDGKDNFEVEGENSNFIRMDNLIGRFRVS